MANTQTFILDNYTLDLLREAAEKRWEKEHPKFVGHAPQSSNQGLVIQAVTFFTSTFERTGAYERY